MTRSTFRNIAILNALTMLAVIAIGVLDAPPWWLPTLANIPVSFAAGMAIQQWWHLGRTRTVTQAINIDTTAYDRDLLDFERQARRAAAYRKGGAL